MTLITFSGESWKKCREAAKKCKCSNCGNKSDRGRRTSFIHRRTNVLALVKLLDFVIARFGGGGSVGVQCWRLYFFGVVGLQPPWLRMVLTQYIAPLADTATVVVLRGISLSTAVAASSSVFKHRVNKALCSCNRSDQRRLILTIDLSTNNQQKPEVRIRSRTQMRISENRQQWSGSVFQ